MSALAHHGDRSLDALAVDIRDAHNMVENAARSTVEYAIHAGELLIEAKAQVRHGEWLPWLEANFPGSERTARGYMQVASNRQRVADLGSYREALAELAEPRAVATTEAPGDEEEAQSHYDTPPVSEVGFDEPDPVQASIIEQVREREGEEAARAAAESMNVAYPEPVPSLAPEPDFGEPKDVDEDEEVVDGEIVDERDEPAPPARADGKAVRLPSLLGDLAALARVVEAGDAAASLRNKNTTVQEKDEWVKQWKSALTTLGRFGREVEAA